MNDVYLLLDLQKELIENDQFDFVRKITKKMRSILDEKFSSKDNAYYLKEIKNNLKLIKKKEENLITYLSKIKGSYNNLTSITHLIK